MSRTIQAILPFLIFIFLSSNYLFGQGSDLPEQGQKYLITILDTKQYYVGTIKTETKDSLWVLADGELEGLSRQQIASIEVYSYNGKFYRLDRNMSRHILAPTARGLDKGQFYYQNGLLTGNLMEFGISKHFSVKTGASIFSIVYDELTWYIAPKLSFEVNPNVYFSYGVIAAGVLDVDGFQELDLDELLLVSYVNATFGPKDYNITIGLGYGSEDIDRDNKVTAGMFGFNLRLSERLVFVSENTVAARNRENRANRNYYLGGHTIRFISRKNTFDVGVLTLGLDGSFFPVPYLGYVRFF